MATGVFPRGNGLVRLMCRTESGGLECRGQSHSRSIFEGTVAHALSLGDGSLFIEEADNKQLELGAYAVDRTRAKGVARVEGTASQREDYAGAGEVGVQSAPRGKSRESSKGVRCGDGVVAGMKKAVAA